MEIPAIKAIFRICNGYQNGKNYKQQYVRATGSLQKDLNKQRHK